MSALPHFENFDEGVPLLPKYSRSLLKIQVPVVVKLAETKQPLSRILELAPGTILQLDKSYEETLTLEIGDQEVAEGEVVKVGDKFGLRLTSICLPKERFITQAAANRSESPES